MDDIADIDIRVGRAFTTAKIGEATVAVLWGQADQPGPYYVSNGTGLPHRCGNYSEASAALMAIAMSGLGAATVTSTLEDDDVTYVSYKLPIPARPSTTEN